MGGDAGPAFDGVTARLSVDRFLMTTTTGNAARVLDWLEEWLQTEWPELRVYCTTVTEQWATTAVVGPNARKILTALAPDMDFAHGFHLLRELGMTTAGAPLSLDALTAIHWTHRVGAVVTLLYLGAFAVALTRTAGVARLGAVLAVLLVLQVSLGAANVVLTLPLPDAVAHNAVAAALLVMMVMLNFALSRTGSTSR